MALFRRRPIEAVQFDPQAESLPSGVSASEDSPSGYIFDGVVGAQPISPGDYLVSGYRGIVRLMRQADFEEIYESAQ
jgi:hypothetical protein